MTPILDVRNISKSFADGNRQIQVLDDVSLTLGAGESLAITGPSGSGKSTLLNLIAGLLEPDKGDIRIHLEEAAISLNDLGEKGRTNFRRQHIGYVYQFFNLVPTLTVLENVRLPARLNKRPDLDGYARELLIDFGLGDRLDVFPEVLSGGEQQRVAVARSLIVTPPVILADEPTGNLDVENTRHVSDILFSAARQLNVALVIATHNLEIASMADHTMHLGEVSTAHRAP